MTQTRLAGMASLASFLRQRLWRDLPQSPVVLNPQFKGRSTNRCVCRSRGLMVRPNHRSGHAGHLV